MSNPRNMNAITLKSSKELQAEKATQAQKSKLANQPDPAAEKLDFA